MEVRWMSVAAFATYTRGIRLTAASSGLLSACLLAWLFAGTPSAALGRAQANPLTVSTLDQELPDRPARTAGQVATQAVQGDKKTLALDAIPEDGGAKFGDWTIWRYDGGDKAIFLINQKSGYAIYLPWSSNGWINFRTGDAVWYVVFTTGQPEKQNRPDLPIAKFIDRKPPPAELATGKYKFMNWTVEVTANVMQFHGSDFNASITFNINSPVFVHNDRKIGEKK
jgi:hypothetical protein